MPSQLINNDNVSFICARDFVYAGEEYKLGQDFDQEIAVGQIELLVRTRRLIPVVEDSSVKPRHFHREVQIRENVLRKLGVLKREKSTTVVGESLYNKPKQMDLENNDVEPGSASPWEETTDPGAALRDQAIANHFTEQVLKEENEEVDHPGEDEETEPEPLVHPAEHEEGDDEGPADVLDENVEGNSDERAITEDDLWDPNKHGVDEVLDYLTGDISEDERQRVIAAERTGKARKGILNHV